LALADVQEVRSLFNWDLCSLNGQRRDRFNVDVHDGKAATAAKALPKDALVEITGKLRHDRWQDQPPKAWRGKIYIAVELGEGTLRSQGFATAQAA
jgi:single-stranded DNA-binding protein